jgi:hypothetical protein
LLASAGTGDVLAGAIAGLLAQGVAPFEAAACGVYLHGYAAEETGEDLGDRGLLASDLLAALPRAIRIVLHGRPARGLPQFGQARRRRCERAAADHMNKITDRVKASVTELTLACAIGSRCLSGPGELLRILALELGLERLALRFRNG